MRNTLTSLLAATALVVGLSGCSTVQKGTAAGGALGALVGGVVGHNVGSVGTGIAIGTGAGAATGGLAGEAYARTTEDDIHREIQNLRAELETAERELAMLRENSVSPEVAAELESARGELEALRAQLDEAQTSAARAQAQLTSRQADLAQRDADLSATRTSLDDARRRLDTASAERDEMGRRLASAETDLAAARKQLNVVQTSLAEKEMAVNSMRDELSKLNVQLDETSRGLQLTIVDQLLFTPGSADLSKSGAELMASVAEIIRKNYPDRELLIEGHTDNVPIKHSGWRSNWELGSARALAVLHELVDKHSFDPMALSASSFGEFRPTATNATPEGRAANRRSVIVIVPEKMPLQRNQIAGL